MEDHQMVEDLFLMRSINQPLILMVTYLSLVLVVGPYFMSKTKKIDLSPVIRVYNVLQIICNFCVFTMGLKFFPHFSIWYDAEDAQDPQVGVQFTQLCHLYLMSKIFDLVETIFFILRKKPEQVSFLHVYHHIGVIWVAWFSCKYFRGAYGTLPIVFNTFVHTFMYLYYLQSSRGKVMSNMWKQCLTLLQIGHQIVIFVLYVMLVIVTKSIKAKVFFGSALLYGGGIILLFLRFYSNSYSRKKL